MMKSCVYVAIMLLVSGRVFAVEDELDFTDIEDAKETGRFAFVSLDPTTGAVSFTFNSTSLQYALLAGLALFVLGIPLLGLLGLLGLIGIGKDKGEDDASYAYAYEQPVYQSAQPNTGYNTYAAKRSLSLLGPVMEALSKRFKKYEEDDEKDE